MARREKDIDKIRQNPKNVRFEMLDKILRLYGFVCRQPKGGSSHYIYTLKVKAKSYRITVPYKKPFLREVYIKEVLKIIDEIEYSSDISNNDDLRNEN